MNKRIFVEKRKGYRQAAESLKQQLNDLFDINLKTLRSMVIYDIFNCDETTFELAKKSIFSEPLIDQVFEQVDLNQVSYLAYEPLSGQFDQRADSAQQCLRLLDPFSQATIKSGRLLIFDRIDQKTLDQLKAYLINTVESQEKDLRTLSNSSEVSVLPMAQYPDFISWDKTRLQDFYDQGSFAMSFADMCYIQDYFKQEQRSPTEMELKVLDTYWSDHCRHTTFMTELVDIKFNDFSISPAIQAVFQSYLSDRKRLNRQDKPLTLMDIATINARLEKAFNTESPIEISDEVNACSVVIDVDHDQESEKWLLMFKNETHNHPTEIEPFGGASTCIGGAIRDPLSGRAYVYQAMRISGSGNVLTPLKETLPDKLPQSLIATKATAGNASYGNQIGLPTTYVQEIYHDSYVAKHLECGAVVGAVKQSDVVRKQPVAGDVILLLGGKTGRDGIGGATGSSISHQADALVQSAAQVQKGNAPEEHKLQRLFRHPEVTLKIKRCNDFGAGGVSVAIGELADGLNIQLDKIKVKYQGLNPTELAISESQERMAVVVAKEDVPFLIEAAFKENCEAYEVAQVTDTNRLVMTYHDQVVVDLKRDFLNSAGVSQQAQVQVTDKPVNVFTQRYSLTVEALRQQVSDLRFASQKGLIERFDHTIGASTVLGGLCGQYQLTPATASVQLLPMPDGKTNTCSILAYGFIPEIFESSAFLGAQYSIIESVSKTLAVGGKLDRIYLSLQEYFGRLTTADKWGNVFQALLGAYHTMKQLNISAIGGKDSMSGTFKQLDVIDTVISFACSYQQRQAIISPELKQIGNNLYLLLVKHNSDGEIDYDDLKQKYQQFQKYQDVICSAMTTDRATAALTLFKMALGNKLGFTINAKEAILTSLISGSIIFETNQELNDSAFIKLGTVSQEMIINGVLYPKEQLIKDHLSPLEKLYPITTPRSAEKVDVPWTNTIQKFQSLKPVEQVRVVIPVFPGTNCEYDSALAFRKHGAQVDTVVFNNLTPQAIADSIQRLVEAIKQSDIIFLAGGFSAGDEPDGSAKYIVNVLKNEQVKQAVHEHLKQRRLILGICNGFQALIKSGLLPYGEIRDVEETGITLFHNEIGHHVSTWVKTICVSNNSPWLSSIKPGTIYSVPVSHGEGRIVGDVSILSHQQIAFQYCDETGKPTMVYPDNPNGSALAIEGLLSKDGLILGKMAHSERVQSWQTTPQDIFANAMAYFRKKESK